MRCAWVRCCRTADINVLRGIEGSRMKRTYQNLSRQYGIEWRGRRYDRAHPTAADVPNQGINHASVAVTAAAVIAVTSLGAIPQLGFIHEHSGEAFALDIADLFRDTVLLPAAFKSAAEVAKNPRLEVERHTRRTTGDLLRSERVIPKMIDRIKTLFQDVPPLEVGPVSESTGDVSLMDGWPDEETGEEER